MRAAQFSSRGATPHEEQALLKQAKAVAAQQEAAQPGFATRGKGSRGRGRGAASGRPGTANGPESPPPQAGLTTHATQGEAARAPSIHYICECMHANEPTGHVRSMTVASGCKHQQVDCSCSESKQHPEHISGFCCSIHICQKPIWKFDPFVRPRSFFIPLAPYSLGCGASCDSSDILA